MVTISAKNLKSGDLAVYTDSRPIRRAVEARLGGRRQPVRQADGAVVEATIVPADRKIGAVAFLKLAKTALVEQSIELGSFAAFDLGEAERESRSQALRNAEEAGEPDVSFAQLEAELGAAELWLHVNQSVLPKTDGNYRPL